MVQVTDSHIFKNTNTKHSRSDNTFIGSESGYDLNTRPGGTLALRKAASYNTFVGDSTGVDVGHGSYNTFLGQAAGATTEYGSYNTYLGFEAGFSNRIGHNSIGIGSKAYYLYSGEHINVNRALFVGTNSRVKRDDAILIGHEAKSEHYRNMTIGNYGYNNGQETISIGYKNYAPNGSHYSVLIGANDTITKANSVGLGYKVSVKGDFSTAIGNNVRINNGLSYASAIGTGHGMEQHGNQL